MLLGLAAWEGVQPGAACFKPLLSEDVLRTTGGGNET